VRGSHRLKAVRAHLLERAGKPHLALADYRAAARGTASLPERNYLLSKAAAIADANL
jgi:predicted RNA polymerase sigma factor